MSAKGLIVPTKGETGNYQEDDYILDANGDRTQQLKEGTDGLLMMIWILILTISVPQVSVWLSIWEQRTN